MVSIVFSNVVDHDVIGVACIDHRMPCLLQNIHVGVCLNLPIWIGNAPNPLVSRAYDEHSSFRNSAKELHRCSDHFFVVAFGIPIVHGRLQDEESIELLWGKALCVQHLFEAVDELSNLARPMDRELRIYPMWAPSMLVGGPDLLEGSLWLLLSSFLAEPFGIFPPI